MFYSKNLPTWERLVRVLAAVAMGSCAAHYWGTPFGYVWAASGIIMALTSVVGSARCAPWPVEGLRPRTRCSNRTWDELG